MPTRIRKYLVCVREHLLVEFSMITHNFTPATVEIFYFSMNPPRLEQNWL